jgi:hypothetical protein
MKRLLPTIARMAALGPASRLALLFALLGCGLAVGACSKCDVPTWQHSQLGQSATACHDGPAPQ